jgi:hypothetical protein
MSKIHEQLRKSMPSPSGDEQGFADWQEAFAVSEMRRKKLEDRVRDLEFKLQKFHFVPSGADLGPQVPPQKVSSSAPQYWEVGGVKKGQKALHDDMTADQLRGNSQLLVRMFRSNVPNAACKERLLSLLKQEASGAPMEPISETIIQMVLAQDMTFPE